MAAGQKVRGAMAALLILCFMSVAGLANGFTIEQVMSSPFPSELVAAPAGDRIAWVFNWQGKRNLWVAEAPAYRARQLTRYDRDDGRELTSPVFSPDGSMIAYVRGGAANAEGEHPNPDSDPAGAKQEVWLVATRTGRVTRVGEGAAPLFSPRGDRVIFTRDGRLYEVPVAGGAARQMFEMRGEVASPAWSPDGSQLAFASVRGDHNFIAVYDARRARLRVLDASFDRDIEPRWSPDGRHIAFIRLFNVADTYAAEKERLQPWAIRVVEVASGRAREVWRSGTAEVDSFSLSNTLGANILQWAAGERLVFGSERDGWAHLYAVPAAGGEAVLLTPGEYEVEDMAWSPDRSFAVIAANAGDIDRRHLWRVNVAGGPPQPITSGSGIETYPVVVDGGRRIAFLRPTGRDPLLPFLASADGTNQRPLTPPAMMAGFPSAALVEPQQVIIRAADGLRVHCQLFKSPAFSGRRPAVIFMHGGPQRQMLLGWHYGRYYHNAYAFNQYLASRGYVVLSVNFRSGIGYGRAFREAPKRGPRGASEYQDIVAAGRYLRERDDVDGKRIGLWGGSYGGYLTAMGLARDSQMFAAGVDIHGVHDWSARVGRAPWATGALSQLGRESSPIAAIDKWKSPVLLIHGDDDRNVAFAQTVDLVRRLRERGVEFEQMVFADEVHDFLRHENWVEIYRAAGDFFDRRLK